MKKILIIAVALLLGCDNSHNNSNKKYSQTENLEEYKDSVRNEIYSGNLIYDKSEFNIRLDSENDNVYILEDYNVKCFFPSEPLENTFNNIPDIFGSSFYSEDEFSVTTLTIIGYKSKKTIDSINLNKDVFFKTALDGYLNELYGAYGLSYKYDILDKIKFNNLYDGYVYQVNSEGLLCHKGSFFINNTTTYNYNVKASCEDMPLINKTEILMKLNFEILND